MSASIIKQPVADLMNQQLISEFGASAQYLAIAIYFDQMALPELAGYFYNQAEEAGADPIIPATGELKNDFTSPEEAVQFALTQELRVTGEINQLATTAKAEDDHISSSFLQWFVNEQVEEIDTMTTLLQTIRHANGNLLWVEDFVRRNPQGSGANSQA
jgi:bacterioferritin B